MTSSTTPARTTVEALALFAALLATFGELHPACDHALIAAEAVSNVFGVSLSPRCWPLLSGRGSVLVSRSVGVNAVCGDSLLAVAA